MIKWEFFKDSNWRLTKFQGQLVVGNLCFRQNGIRDCDLRRRKFAQEKQNKAKEKTMILADKIIELRKKNNWSQEELAGKLGVSRQSISKWEGAQSTPDLQRILEMSKLFGVSTDSLIKDEIELGEETGGFEDSQSPVRMISMEEANTYLEKSKKGANSVALGVMLSIFGAIPFILEEDFASRQAEALSLTLALFFIGVGVSLIILTAYRMKEYDWIEKESFETAYGVDGMAQERYKTFMPSFVTRIISGVLLCFLAVAFFGSSEFLPGIIPVTENAVDSLGLAMLAIAVFLFVSSTIARGAYLSLLQIEDFRPEEKKVKNKIGPYMSIYWLVVIAIYLGYSFLTQKWEKSWIILSVAAVLGVVLAIILKIAFGRNRTGNGSVF